MTNGPAGSAAGTALGHGNGAGVPRRDQRLQRRVRAHERRPDQRADQGRARNDVRGSVYEFHRNDALDAKNYFDVGGKPPFTRNQFGGAAGRPDAARTSCSTSSATKALRENLGRTITSTRARRERAPRAAAGSGQPGAVPQRRRQPAAWRRISNEYPLPNGANLGDGTALYSFQFDQTLDQNFVQGRVDYNRRHRAASSSRATRSTTPTSGCRPTTRSSRASFVSRNQFFTGEYRQAASREPARHAIASATAARASARRSRPTRAAAAVRARPVRSSATSTSAASSASARRARSTCASCSRCSACRPIRRGRAGATC